MDSEPIKRTRGRPRDPLKRQKLLTAARKLFLELGADAVTVDQVLLNAGVSRATYYSNFTDRHQLLAAVFEEESRRIVSDDAEQEFEIRDVREALTSYGDNIMQFLADPDVMSFEPLIMHVRGSQPGLAAMMYEAGCRRAWNYLARIILAGQARGELRQADPDQAVSDLIGLWNGNWRTQIQYGQRPVPGEAELREKSRHAVDIFMRAYAPVE